MSTAATQWPTLGDMVKSWSGTCDYCGNGFPADTLILARWSSTVFHISCKCSPQTWVTMEVARP